MAGACGPRTMTAAPVRKGNRHLPHGDGRRFLFDNRLFTVGRLVSQIHQGARARAPNGQTVPRYTKVSRDETIGTCLTPGAQWTARFPIDIILNCGGQQRYAHLGRREHLRAECPRAPEIANVGQPAQEGDLIHVGPAIAPMDGPNRAAQDRRQTRTIR